MCQSKNKKSFSNKTRFQLQLMKILIIYKSGNSKVAENIVIENMIMLCLNIHRYFRFGIFKLHFKHHPLCGVSFPLNNIYIKGIQCQFMFVLRVSPTPLRHNIFQFMYIEKS